MEAEAVDLDDQAFAPPQEVDLEPSIVCVDPRVDLGTGDAKVAAELEKPLLERAPRARTGDVPFVERSREQRGAAAPGGPVQHGIDGPAIEDPADQRLMDRALEGARRQDLCEI